MQRLRWDHERKYGAGLQDVLRRVMYNRGLVYTLLMRPCIPEASACASEGTLAITPSCLSEANTATDVTQLMQQFKYEIQRLAPLSEEITF